jgi:pimeloyl-ACP methyl ester carboxylesterase
MAAALELVRARRGNPELALIGYSGGGTLAMLLAPRVPGVGQLVTLGGNLDPQRWALLHGYSPLETSLNPSREDPLPPAIRQIHIVADDDRNVPPGMARAALAGQPAAEIWVLPDADHRCCWAARWPELLERLGVTRRGADQAD